MTTQTGMHSCRIFKKYFDRLPKGLKTAQTGMMTQTDMYSKLFKYF